MGEDLKEKEFYRGSIMGMLENMNLEKLVFIYVFIAEITKENER